MYTNALLISLVRKKTVFKGSQTACGLVSYTVCPCPLLKNWLWLNVCKINSREHRTTFAQASQTLNNCISHEVMYYEKTYYEDLN